MLHSTVQQYVFWQEKDAFLLETDIDAHWIMYIIEAGSCQFSIGDQTGLAVAGDVLLCPPYTIFAREVQESLTFHFLRFALRNDLIDPEELSGSLAIIEQERLTFTCHLLKTIQYDDSPKIKSFRDHLLDDILFLYFYDNSLVLQTQHTHIKDALVLKSLPLLADLTQDSLSIAEISEKLTINPCHFSRKFKQIMGGVTPVEYRNRIRLQEAQKQLIETNNAIEQIAESCGYSNAFYFSRIFAKFMGEAPSSYRNNHKI